MQKLKANPTAFGIFGFSFLDQNTDSIKSMEIGGGTATFEAIASGEYPISRALYLYIKKAHVGVVPGIREYLEEFLGDRASGNEGYLADKGLIPMPVEEKAAYTKVLREMMVLPAKI